MPKLMPDTALHFSWAICSWILALSAVVFLLYCQLHLLFSFLYVGAADLWLVLFLVPVYVSIGFYCGFVSGGLYELHPCVQLVLVWLIFSSLLFMVSVGAIICTQPPLALTSVSSVSVGVQVLFPAVTVFPAHAAAQVTFPAMSAPGLLYSTGTSLMARQIPFPVVPSCAATQVPFPVMHASVPTQVPFPAMSAPGVFCVASTCSLATQVPFPVMPADMTTRVPFPVFPDIGPGSSNCVLSLPQVVRP